MPDLVPHRDRLLRLTRTDPDPRVRRRADGLLLLAGGLPIGRAAGALGTSEGRLRAWRRRFLAEGRDGLADRPRRGRPPKLDDAARGVLEAALARSPLDDGYPVTVWTVADLVDLLERRGWAVSAATVYRALRALGYRYRRPRHDLTHRQDTEAVASAAHALTELQKRGLLSPGATGPGSGSFTWTSAISTPIPTWLRSGSGAERP